MTWDNWVINATMQDFTDENMVPGTFEFNPVEGELGSGEESIVVGMSVIAGEPPHGGRVVGVVHEDGQKAVERFVDKHRKHLKKFGFDK